MVNAHFSAPEVVTARHFPVRSMWTQTASVWDLMVFTNHSYRFHQITLAWKLTKPHWKHGHCWKCSFHGLWAHAGIIYLGALQFIKLTANYLDMNLSPKGMMCIQAWKKKKKNYPSYATIRGHQLKPRKALRCSFWWASSLVWVKAVPVHHTAKESHQMVNLPDTPCKSDTIWIHACHFSLVTSLLKAASQIRAAAWKSTPILHPFL